MRLTKLVLGEEEDEQEEERGKKKKEKEEEKREIETKGDRDGERDWERQKEKKRQEEKREEEREREGGKERERERERFTHFSTSSQRHRNCSGCNSTFDHKFHTCFVYLASGCAGMCQEKTVLDADTIRGHEKEKEDCMDLKIAKRMAIAKLTYEK